jgi:hypothetical protein
VTAPAAALIGKTRGVALDTPSSQAATRRRAGQESLVFRKVFIVPSFVLA